MLYVHEKVAKLGGILLGGQVSSVEIQESATIYVAQDDKGKVKKTQPVGYDNAKVIIDIILEDSPEETSLEQLTNMQRLFRTNGQTQAKLFTIVNEDCAARDIFQVYFKSLSSKKVISESKRIVSLELWAPKVATIEVVKKTSKPGTSTGKTVENESPEDTQSDLTAKKGKSGDTKNKSLTNAKDKSNKARDKSPAKDTRNTESGKKAANKATKSIRRNTT